MWVFRIVREKYLDSVLSGMGAQLSSGFRWNSLGTPMVYTAGTRSLAMLEIAVHLDLAEDLPGDRYMVEIEIPEKISVLSLATTDLPKNWDAKPPENLTRSIGDDFVRTGVGCILRVPSSIIHQEFNYLINPLHVDLGRVKNIQKKAFHFDERLNLPAN